MVIVFGKSGWTNILAEMFGKLIDQPRCYLAVTTNSDDFSLLEC